MLRQDPPALPDDEGMILAEMAAVDQQLGGRAVEVRAGVGHDAVGPAVARWITAVGDDRVILHRRVDPQVAKGQEPGMFPRQLVDAGGKPFPEGVEEEIGSVTREDRLIGALQGVYMPDESRAERVDRAPIETAAPVGGGDEDDAADPWQRLEEEGATQELAGLGRAVEPIGGPGTDGLPEAGPAVLGHQLREEAAQAVADQDHPVEGRIGAVRVVSLAGLE